MISVWLAGEQVNLLAGSLAIDDTFNERDYASLALVDYKADLEPAKGALLEIYDGDLATYDDTYTDTYDGTALIFAGYVEDPEFEEVGKGPTRFHTLRVVDHHYLADKRLAAISYEDETVEDIVADLHDRYLDDEGIDLGTVDAGPTVELIVFPWVPVSEALSELAELAGYWWYITPDKELEFRSRDAFDAPWSASGPDVLRDPTPKLSRRAPDYRNVQLIRNVRDRTDSQSESFVGDGEARTFSVGFRIAETPTIEVNSTEKTVGIRGVDDDTEWYWNKDDRTVSQDSSETKLTSSDTLEVTYVGFFDAVIRSENDDEIDARQDVEGGSGRVEHILSDKMFDGRTQAFEVAAAKLEKYGQIGRTFTFTTRRKGLRAGHLLDVTLSPYDLDGDGLLITNIRTFDHQGSEVRYQVTCVEGPHEQSWARFFARIFKVPDVLVWTDNIDQQDVLVRLFEYDKEWDDTDDQPDNFWYEVWPDDSLMPASDLWPQIDRDDWLTWIEVWRDSAPVFRKQVTSRDTVDDQIESSWYLSPLEANGDVDELRFYSGIGATEENESGVLTATETVADTKTVAEAWQIDRDDTRADTPAGWWERGDVP